MAETKSRVRRSEAEKRRIVELTLQSGMSVARVAQAEGVNSHQIFQWRRAYREGTLSEASADVQALLPVLVAPSRTQTAADHESSIANSSRESIQIELPSRARITIGSGTDLKLLRAILESLQR